MPDLATPAAPAPAAPAPPSAPSPAPAPAPSTPAAPAAPLPAAAPAPSQPDTRDIHTKLADGLRKAREQVAAEHPELAAGEPEAEPALPAPGAASAEEHPAAAPEVEVPAVEPEAAPEVEQPAAEADALAALDDGTPWSAEDLQALDGALKDNPQRARIMQALRREADTRQIREIFPTKEAAETAAQGYGLYQNLDTRFLGATTKEGASKFLNEWVKQAIVNDDQGKPVVENGQYKFHPALLYTLNHIVGNRLDVLQEQAKTSGDERLAAAVEYIREVTQGPSSPALGDVPEEVRPFAESVKSREDAVRQREEALTRQQREEAQRTNQQAIERVESQVYDTLNAQLKDPFAKSGLSKFEQGAAYELIGNRLEDRLRQHPMYNAQRASILAQRPSDARDAQLRKHDLTYMQEMIGPIAAQVIREAKGGTLTRQTERQDRVTQQQRENREPRVSTAAPRTQPTTPAQMRAQIVSDYKAANNGAEPESDFVRSEMLKRSTLPAMRR